MLIQAQAFVNSLGGQVAIISMVVEMAFRLIKTDKPLSIAYVISDGCHKVGNLMVSVGSLLDKVLPQKLK